MRKTFSIILRMGISFLAMGILLFVIRRDLGNILQLIKQAQARFIFISICLIYAGLGMLALRFKNVLKIQGIDISYNSALYLTLIGHFFNTLMPSAIGGDIVKAYYASKQTSRGFETYASVFADRFVGLLGVLAIAAVSLIFYGHTINNMRVMWAVIVMLAVSISAILFIFNPRLQNIAARYKKLQSLSTAVKNLRLHKDLMAVALIITVATQALFISSVYFIGQSLSLTLSLMILFLILPIIWALTLLPSINGLGIREGAFVYFLGSIVGKDGAFAISLLWLALGVFGVALIGGIAYACHQVRYGYSH